MSDSTIQASIGVIGGSGLYSLFTEADRPQDGETPYGTPSAPATVGKLAERATAFLPRHGTKHALPPHKVNFRANLWSLRQCGVRQVIGVGAVGSLNPDIPRGSLVVPDQIVDRTSGRDQSFFEGPEVFHAPFADPYCPQGRGVALEAAEKCEWPAVDGGTQVVIQGPRFSTRAESQWYAAQGWSIVGMTAHPEVVLARELGMCYTPLCLVTDMDAGVGHGSGVTQEEVFAAFAENMNRVREVLSAVVGGLPEPGGCTCDPGAPAPR